MQGKSPKAQTAQPPPSFYECPARHAQSSSQYGRVSSFGSPEVSTSSSAAALFVGVAAAEPDVTVCVTRTTLRDADDEDDVGTADAESDLDSEVAAADAEVDERTSVEDEMAAVGMPSAGTGGTRTALAVQSTWPMYRFPHPSSICGLFVCRSVALMPAAFWIVSHELRGASVLLGRVRGEMGALVRLDDVRLLAVVLVHSAEAERLARHQVEAAVVDLRVDGGQLEPVGAPSEQSLNAWTEHAYVETWFSAEMLSQMSPGFTVYWRTQPADTANNARAVSSCVSAAGAARTGGEGQEEGRDAEHRGWG
jgi:hypothetical protein